MATVVLGVLAIAIPACVGAVIDERKGGAAGATPASADTTTTGSSSGSSGGGGSATTAASSSSGASSSDAGPPIPFVCGDLMCMAPGEFCSVWAAEPPGPGPIYACPSVPPTCDPAVDGMFGGLYCDCFMEAVPPIINDCVFDGGVWTVTATGP